MSYLLQNQASQVREEYYGSPQKVKHPLGVLNENLRRWNKVALDGIFHQILDEKLISPVVIANRVVAAGFMPALQFRKKILFDEF